MDHKQAEDVYAPLHKMMRWKAPLIAIASVLIILLGVDASVETWRYRTYGLTATGTLTDTVMQLKNEKMFYYPVISFKDQSGKVITFKEKNSISRPHETGASVPVIYFANDPEGSARIDKGWSTSVSSIGFGVLFLWIARVIWRRGASHRR